MSYLLKIDDSLLELDLESDVEIDADAKPIGALYQSLREWDSLGAIREISFIRDGVDPNLYHYTIENGDGHLIRTTFLVASAKDTDPMLTITIDPAWKMSVVAFGGAVRKQLLELRALVGILNFTVVFE